MKRLIALATLALVIVGCSSGTSSGGGLFLGGAWQGVIRANSPAVHVAQVRLNLAQSQDDPSVYTGTGEISGSSCWVGGVWTVTVSGNAITVAFEDVNDTAFSGSGTATNREMKGLFTSSGDACGPLSSEWQLNRR